ncbi:MAG: L-threonylcarbamoyladenylate synthase [Chitinispirillaceae bacterium]|jgi:L-threonylcarbamoyladenylate synthase
MTPTERITLAGLLKEQCQTGLRTIADRIKNGAIFVYPTETIYGLGGSSAVFGVKKRISEIKQRAAGNELILIAPDRSFFSTIPLIMPLSAEALAAAFWPGRLTLVLPLREAATSLAIRVTQHPFIEAIFRYLDAPLFSTSANLSGKAYVNDPAIISGLFAGKVDFMIDAGPLPESLPSTVVKVGLNGTVQVLREGAIEARRIFEAAGQAVK